MKWIRSLELTMYYKVTDALSTTKTGDVLKSADFVSYNCKYTNIQPQYPVTIYKNGTVYTDAYTIDYRNGIITFPSALLSTDAITADYTYCYINIYDEGQNPYTNNDFKYPSVSVYEDKADTQPYELGNSQNEIVSNWIVEIWSERGGERNDITDTLMELFEGDQFAIQDFNQGFPLNSNGTQNTNFSYNTRIAQATINSINYEKGGSLDIGDKPKFLSHIYLELIINR